MIVIRRLIWDSWNITHIARHDVTPDEVEDVCHGEYMASQSYKGRMLAIILAPGKEEHITSLLHIMPTQESSSVTLN